MLRRREAPGRRLNFDACVAATAGERDFLGPVRPRPSPHRRHMPDKVAGRRGSLPAYVGSGRRAARSFLLRSSQGGIQLDDSVRAGCGFCARSLCTKVREQCPGSTSDNSCAAPSRPLRGRAAPAPRASGASFHLEAPAYAGERPSLRTSFSNCLGRLRRGERHVCGVEVGWNTLTISRGATGTSGAHVPRRIVSVQANCRLRLTLSVPQSLPCLYGCRGASIDWHRSANAPPRCDVRCPQAHGLSRP